MKRWLIALVLPVAGCSAAGNWTKPGIDAAAVGREYEDCRTIAAGMVGPETGIDQDILATRHSDIQRSSVMRVEARNLHDETRDRAGRIVDSCMTGKGFGKGGS